MLTTTRSDHGAMHDGKYAAYVRVSTDAQDVANQEHGIKAYLNGGDFDVKWYREEGVSSGEDWQEILPGKIKLVVVDDPTLDETTIGFKAMFAQHERTQIKQRTKLALGRIKSEIAEKGSYTTKAGNVITKLGVHDNLGAAGKKGVASSINKADARASDVWPIIQNLLVQGASLRSIPRSLNDMGVATPTKRRNPDISKRTEWHASSVRNYINRMEGK